MQYQQYLLMRNLGMYNFEHRIEMFHLDKEQYFDFVLTFKLY